MSEDIHKVIARKDGDWVRLYSRFGTIQKITVTSRTAIPRIVTLLLQPDNGFVTAALLASPDAL